MVMVILKRAINATHFVNQELVVNLGVPMMAINLSVVAPGILKGK
jgi:hypothetical protein